MSGFFDLALAVLRVLGIGAAIGFAFGVLILAILVIAELAEHGGKR